MAVPHPDAVVVRGDCFVASRFPYPVLNNAVIFDAPALDAVREVYGAEPYAVWSETADEEVASVLTAGGFRRDITTRPMLCRLADADLAEAGPGPVSADVDPSIVAELNGVTADLVRGVPGLRAYATAGFESGLIVLPVGTDANISFVATRPDARRRGFGSRVVRAALRDALDDGYLTASLQAMPLAEPMYIRVGFRSVGQWQEWVPT